MPNIPLPSRQPLTISVLIVLAGGDLHGYGVYKQVMQDGQGTILVSDRRVYRELARLLEENYISTHIIANTRVHYHLEPKGRRLLLAERRRIQVLHRLFQERLL